ncbi:DUF6328 family protein [Rathayibacter sp. YIM 133350]|uniref:DUF6328 family protein n=1 Tax=Rathayibacter sp. YIM 133350 TaxID=3131992 RepID=UPI00307FA23D
MAAHPNDDAERHETPTEKLDRNWSDILQELRVTQTGTQIIGGFLLTVAFQQRFSDLDAYGLTLYLILVGLAGLSTAIGLAPVSEHRTYFRRHVKSRVVDAGNRFLIAQVVVVGLLTAGVTSLIFDFTLGRTAGIIAGIVALLVIGTLWVLLPRARRKAEGAREDDEIEDGLTSTSH